MKWCAAAWFGLMLGTVPVLAQAPAAPPLIVISIDAFRADYLDRGLTPNLAALARTGVRAAAMRPSFPTQTFPNHVTLVTGLVPDHHGLIGNILEDKAVAPDRFTKTANSYADPRWWNGGTPLWTTAQKAGRITASFGWPGSDVRIQGGRVTYSDFWRADHAPAEGAAMALNWMRLPARLRPAIQFLYLDAVDEAGHRDGPDSAAVNAALRDVDAAIGTLVKGLKASGQFARANIVVLSDHGLSGVANARSVVLDDLIDPSRINLTYYGPAAALDPLPGHEAAVEKALVGRHDHATCWRKAEIPARLRYGTNPRVPAIVCAADDGWRIVTHAIMAGWTRENRGDHGYDPDNPHMRALFLAHGPAFRPGTTLPLFDNVDVYPLLAKLSGLTPEKNDGTLATFKNVLK